MAHKCGARSTELKYKSWTKKRVKWIKIEVMDKNERTNSWSGLFGTVVFWVGGNFAALDSFRRTKIARDGRDSVTLVGIGVCTVRYLNFQSPWSWPYHRWRWSSRRASQPSTGSSAIFGERYTDTDNNTLTMTVLSLGRHTAWIAHRSRIFEGYVSRRYASRLCGSRLESGHPSVGLWRKWHRGSSVCRRWETKRHFRRLQGPDEDHSSWRYPSLLIWRH